MALKKSNKKMQISDSESENDEPIIETVKKTGNKTPDNDKKPVVKKTGKKTSDNDEKSIVKKTGKKIPTPNSDSESDSENESDNDEKPIVKKTGNKTSTSDSENDEKPIVKKTGKKTLSSDSESDSDSDNDEKQKVKTLTAEKLDNDDSEEINNKSDLESSSESESESETDKKKDKKIKESFDELIKKLEALQINIKEIDKEVLDLEKKLKVREKDRNNYERQMNAILKILSKTHNDDIQKRLKEKPKRKGNVNGGFCKESPVPEVLIKFLGLDPGTIMRRPKVMSELCNKFKDLGLKHGQDTILDKSTVKALELDKSYDGKVINMKQFQTFLKEFYTKEAQLNTVNM